MRRKLAGQADLGGRVGPGRREGQTTTGRPAVPGPPPKGKATRSDAQQAAGGLLGLVAPAGAGGGGQQGTTLAARAPPTTTSYRTLGTWLAVA